MRFYNSIGPNPRVVTMFMVEKNIEIPEVRIDLRGGENRREPYTTKINPAGQCPALELDDGTVLAEITAICEYLDEIGPAGVTLIGRTPEERSKTRMWVRRIDLNILEPMANGFRYGDGLKLFETRIRCIPQAADDLKKLAAEKLAWLDGQMAGKSWVCGDRFTLADILLYGWLDFAGQVGQPLDTANANIVAWMARVAERPSAKA